MPADNMKKHFLYAPARWINKIPLGYLTLASIGLWNFAATVTAQEVTPLGPGPYPVGSTNMEVAAEYAEIGDDLMHQYLLGRPDKSKPRYVLDILKHPDFAWTFDASIPEQTIYGPVAGSTLPVVAYLVYPSKKSKEPNRYVFPYQKARYGVFQDMLRPGETPSFADPGQRYPLVILAHGSGAHGIFDVAHAHALASHGYVVAVIFYGDDRTYENDESHHVGFLRPLLTQAVIDSIEQDKVFGPHVDTNNVGVSGHSFGGFTALSVAGGSILGESSSAKDDRIKAGVIAAPWVGGYSNTGTQFAFGSDNSTLKEVTEPMICLFGTKDNVTLASFILPAMKKLSGPTYVIELVDQPHVFEGPSWEDRNGWELFFLNAYLKNDLEALEILKTTKSMQGGNKDLQLFDYQSQL